MAEIQEAKVITNAELVYTSAPQKLRIAKKTLVLMQHFQIQISCPADTVTHRDLSCFPFQEHKGTTLYPTEHDD